MDSSEARHPRGPRVRVCGGLDYADRTQAFFELGALRPAAVLVNADSGAGGLALAWCREAGVPARQAAEALDVSVDLILAFPGADGLALAELAARSGAPIKEVAPFTLVVHCKRHPYNVYAGRPSRFGNPFSHEAGTLAQYRVGSREESIERHAAWFLSNPALIERVKRELTGKVIGCWCAPKRCHCDVYARVCNEAAGFVDTTKRNGRRAPPASCAEPLEHERPREVDAGSGRGSFPAEIGVSEWHSESWRDAPAGVT